MHGSPHAQGLLRCLFLPLVIRIATAGSTTPLTPVGSTANTLQATGFIPEIWSAKLVEKFYASTVLSAISNTDYEGEIQNHGDRVKIRTKPTITIKDYQADGLLGLDRPSGGSIELYIGIGKYFSLILDDVMEVQSDLNLLSMWSDDAAQQLKIMVDRDVLGGIVGQSAAKNKGATAGIISGNLNLGIKGTPVTVNAAPTAGQTSILDVLLRLGQVLGRAEHPGNGTLGGDVSGCSVATSNSLNSGRLTCRAIRSLCCATDGWAWWTASPSTSPT